MLRCNSAKNKSCVRIIEPARALQWFLITFNYRQGTLIDTKRSRDRFLPAHMRARSEHIDLLNVKRARGMHTRVREMHITWKLDRVADDRNRAGENLGGDRSPDRFFTLSQSHQLSNVTCAISDGNCSQFRACMQHQCRDAEVRAMRDPKYHESAAVPEDGRAGVQCPVVGATHTEATGIRSVDRSSVASKGHLGVRRQ